MALGERSAENHHGREAADFRRQWPREESNLRTRIRSPSLYPLSYGARLTREGGGWDSNPRPPGPQPGALPTELPPPWTAQDSGVPPRRPSVFRRCNEVDALDFAACCSFRPSANS